jgi:DnaK suppressor protein
MSAPTIYHHAQPPPLGPAEYAELRRELERELARLLSVDQVPKSPDFRVSLAQELSPRPRGYAVQIIDALRRMDNGTYGLCAGCQGRIAFERLSAIPETTVCAACSWTRDGHRGKESFA